jgi:Pyridoxamine 5'-phosphate oxidase
MAFSEEAAYLKSQPLVRIATVGPDGQPDVTPVSFEFDGTYFYLGGWAPEGTRRFRTIKAGNAKVALVVDDLVSAGPWTEDLPVDRPGGNHARPPSVGVSSAPECPAAIRSAGLSRCDRRRPGRRGGVPGFG